MTNLTITKSQVISNWTLVILIFLFVFNPCISYAEPKDASIARLEKSFLEGRYERAIREADNLIDSRSPQRDEIYYLKGLSLLRLSKFKEARSVFEELISRYKNSKRIFDGRVAIGDSYLLEGDTKKAIQIYEEVVNKYSDDKNIPSVYYKLGKSYKEIGEDTKAKDLFDKMKTMSPLSFEARMMPESTVKSNNYFSVQVGYFKTKANAEKLVGELTRKDYEAYTEISKDSGETFYRVKVGRLRSKDEAEDLASKLMKDGYSTKVCD